MKKTERGAAATYALLATVTFLTAMVGAASYAGESMLRAQNESNSTIAFELSQSALEEAITKVASDAQLNKGVVKATSYDFGADLQQAVPGCTASATVALAADGLSAWITSSATYGGKTKSLRTLIRTKDVGIWDNAIFAGASASGQSINGNVDIRGSVHILGDPEPFTDANGDGIWESGESYNDANGDSKYTAALTASSAAATMSGNADVENNYYGMPASLRAMIPNPPQINGLETLNAEVRVKHGNVSISGSATIGTQVGNKNAPNGTKGSIDGSYVSDGYTGSQGASSVYSDNGTSNGYDLSNSGISFPYIAGIGAAAYKGSDGTSYTNEDAYLSGSKTLTCPVTTITASTKAFSYGPDSYGNSISFTPASGSTAALLTVNGVVKFTSKLQIGAKDSIQFAGKGSLYSTTDINIDGNFLPKTGLTFPTNTSIGIIAKNNINLATGNGSSQLQLAGAFYAQNTITSAKQNQILGSFVSSYFNLGSNVPSIYQVPSLVQNMPPAMPGDKSIISIKLHGWRER